MVGGGMVVVVMTWYGGDGEAIHEDKETKLIQMVW